MNEPVANWTVAIDADTSAFRTELNRSADLGRQFGAALGKSFEGLAIQGRGLGDVLKSLGLSLSRMAFSAAFKPLEQVFANAFTGLATGGGLSFGGGATASAIPTPFAKGGVIASPVSFPLGQGTGIAGESGAEAIMPLTRGPDGRLGVAATGGSGIAITFNVTTSDAESFRRSETQLSAMLARAVGSGHRNL